MGFNSGFKGLKKEYSYPSTPPLGLRDLFQGGTESSHRALQSYVHSHKIGTAKFSRTPKNPTAAFPRYFNSCVQNGRRADYGRNFIFRSYFLNDRKKNISRDPTEMSTPSHQSIPSSNWQLSQLHVTQQKITKRKVVVFPCVNEVVNLLTRRTVAVEGTLQAYRMCHLVIIAECISNSIEKTASTPNTCQALSLVFIRSIRNTDGRTDGLQGYRNLLHVSPITVQTAARRTADSCLKTYRNGLHRILRY